MATGQERAETEIRPVRPDTALNLSGADRTVPPMANPGLTGSSSLAATHGLATGGLVHARPHSMMPMDCRPRRTRDVGHDAGDLAAGL